MGKKIQQIDILSYGDHFYLDVDDECYFFLSYTARMGFDYSDDNDIISNLKKPVSYKGTASWKYKERAIDKCSQIIKETDLPKIFGDSITIVPVPPSKTKESPEYDDRLLQILAKSCDGKVDYREIIQQKDNTRASHESDERITKEELKKNYTVDLDACKNIGKTIIIFDDVLTTGTHFKALKELIEEHIEPDKIIGLFIARRVFEDKKEDDFTEFLKSLGIE